MASKKLHIWYAQNGEILAIGSIPEEYAELNLAIQPALAPNQFILEAEVEEELIDRLPFSHKVEGEQLTLINLAGPDIDKGNQTAS